MSEGKGYTDNVEAQAELRELGSELRAFELADLEKVLMTEHGRRFYYRLVYEMARLNGPTADLGIRDGVCGGNHSYYRDGQRWVGRVLMAEAETHFPELWGRMLQERLARAHMELARRDKAKTKGKVDHD